MTNLKYGKFITFEGVDASGKTTNIPVLADHLRERGYKVITTREPGGNPIGDQIRSILLNSEKMDDITELFLFLAARNEHVQKVVRPHLDAGYIVICDRFHDSTFAYQGHARGLQRHLERLNGYVNADIVPNYTLFFDIPFEESVRRLSLRTEKQDRLDQEEEDFRRRVYEGYQQRFERISTYEHAFCRSVHRIDALPDVETVSNSVKAWANSIFENIS